MIPNVCLRLGTPFFRWAVIVSAAFPVVADVHAQDPLRDGTSVLTRRVLSDGTVLVPPAVVGRSSMKDGVNQLLVVWQTPEGRHASVSMLSHWSQTTTALTAKVIVMMVDDGSGKPPTYDLSGRSSTVPVERSGGKARYQHPLNPPKIETDGERLTATFEGAFTDYWERVR